MILSDIWRYRLVRDDRLIADVSRCLSLSLKISLGENHSLLV